MLTRGTEMTVEVINPPGLPTPMGYAQVSVATGGRIVCVSGQVARDAAGQAVGGGDLAAQVEQAYTNLTVALEGAGASFDDVAKLTVYVVDWTPTRWERSSTARRESPHRRESTSSVPSP